MRKRGKLDVFALTASRDTFHTKRESLSSSRYGETALNRRVYTTVNNLLIRVERLLEFIFGHVVMKNSWSNLLDDYNIFAGRVWIIVLLWSAIAPFGFYHFAS